MYEELFAQLADDQQKAVIRYMQELLAVEKLPEPMRELMRLRTLHGLKWEEIAERTHYTVRQCFKYRKKAIEIMKGRA